MITRLEAIVLRYAGCDVDVVVDGVKCKFDCKSYNLLNNMCKVFIVDCFVSGLPAILLKYNPVVTIDVSIDDITLVNIKAPSLQLKNRLAEIFPESILL